MFKELWDWVRGDAVPFSTQDLERMVGKEFYLEIISKEQRRRFREKMPDFPYGQMLEITSRRPGEVEGYLVGNIVDVTYKNATSPVEEINGVSEGFLFELERVRYPLGQSALLEGRSRKYTISTGAIGQERMALLDLQRFRNGYKTRGRIVSF